MTHTHTHTHTHTYIYVYTHDTHTPVLLHTIASYSYIATVWVTCLSKERGKKQQEFTMVSILSSLMGSKPSCSFEPAFATFALTSTTLFNGHGLLSFLEALVLSKISLSLEALPTLTTCRLPMSEGQLCCPLHELILCSAPMHCQSSSAPKPSLLR